MASSRPSAGARLAQVGVGGDFDFEGASFLDRPAAPEAPAAAPDPAPVRELEPAAPVVEQRPPAAPRTRSERPLSRSGPRTTVRFDEQERIWLKTLLIFSLQRDGSGITQDVLVRAIVRAVHELAPEIDISGLEKSDEAEIVERIKDALNA